MERLCARGEPFSLGLCVGVATGEFGVEKELWCLLVASLRLCGREEGRGE